MIISLILSKLIFLILYLSSNYNCENIDEIFKQKCAVIDPNNRKNGFQSLVKLNFETFLCYLYNNIYRKNNKNLDDLSNGLKNINKCKEQIKNSFEDNSNFYYKYLSNSGSRLNKIGNEEKCIKEGLEYVLIEMNLNLDDINKNLLYLLENEDNYKSVDHKSQYLELNGFLENDKYYLGLCLWNNCSSFYNIFFKREENEELFSFLNTKGYTAKSASIIIKKDVDKTGNKAPILISIIFIIMVIFIRFMLILSNYCTKKNQEIEPKYFRLSPSTLYPDEIQPNDQNMNDINYAGTNGELVYDDINDNKKLERMKNFNDNNSDRKAGANEDMKSSKSNSSNTDNAFSSNDSETRISKLSSVMKKKKTQAELFLENYDFISFYNLYNLETKSFNSKKLEEICGFKFFLLLSITFYNVYTTFYKVKWNVPGTLPFYREFLHIILAKASKISFKVWIFFDGFQWCFKLLSYLKKLESKRITLKHILIFNINILEKIVVFIVIFLTFIYEISYFGKTFNLTSSFYMHVKRFTSKKCINNPLYILILPIMGYFEENGKFDNCNNFIYILVNEFYAIIICSFLFYLFFKLKSKKFEIFFLVFFFISILLSFIFFKDIYINKHFYYYRYVLGEDISHKCIGLFFHYFFIGCISGLVYYYSTLMSLDLEQYNPFEMCYNLMYCYSKMNPVLRHFLGFFCIFLNMLICSYFPLLCSLNIIKEFRLVKIVDFLTYMIISYENIINIFLFMIFFFDIILTPDMIIKIFLSNSIFIIFERCSLVFMIINEHIIFLFETLVYLDAVYWNIENIIFLTIICFLITLLASIACTFFIQLPIRLFSKKKAREYLENYESENTLSNNHYYKSF